MNTIEFAPDLTIYGGDELAQTNFTPAISSTLSRRRMLSLAVAASLAAAMPAMSADFLTVEPAWLSDLTVRLHRLSSWVRVGPVLDGAVEIHCGQKDAALWAGASSSIAGKGNQILAAGSALLFSLAAHNVRIVMHPPGSRAWIGS